VTRKPQATLTDGLRGSGPGWLPFRHVRLNVFSDLGGAGVSVVNGVIVKVRKGVGTYDGDELAARAAFQRGFLTTLRQHPDLGATALYPFLVST
jgi:hypothetical protein